MHAAEADNKNLKVSGDDENINFRPSPNFKHMKKYLKSKFDEENSASNNAQTESPSPSTSNKQLETEKATSNQQPSEVQPPLPPNPPPPDSPPVIKKEKEEEEEYSCNPDSQEIHQSDSQIAQYNSEQTEVSEATEETGETMCRNFIRGTCERGAACIFAHKLILSQLKYVYRFCINFQNRTGCTRPQCKFVHASVFEQEYFYKTGYLPPHTMAHLKQENTLPPPPPPAEEIPAEVAPVFINQQPHPQIQIAPTEPSKPIENPATATVDSRMISEVLRAATDIKSSLKRDWSEIDDLVSSPGSPSAKKCKNCDFNEFRLQYIKKKCELIKRSTDDMNKKMSLLNRRSTKLCTILIPLLSQKQCLGNSLINAVSDKDSILMTQLSHLMGTNNRFSLLNEDSGKNNLLNNGIVAKLLLTMREMREKN